jgi:hypothetical protein
MEPESSLACSEDHSTGPYPEPDQSIQQHKVCIQNLSYTEYCLYLYFHGICCGENKSPTPSISGRDGLQIWRVSANILNRQSPATDKGWSSSFGAWLVTKTCKKPREDITYVVLFSGIAFINYSNVIVFEPITITSLGQMWLSLNSETTTSNHRTRTHNALTFKDRL